MKTVILYFFLFMLYPEKRQVLIFYNPDGTALKEKQLAELKKDATGFEDRNMTVQAYAIPTSKAEVKKWHINAGKPFTVILVGKDGGEKLRADTVITTTTFFNTIDAMPMRKSEMKELING